MKQSPESFNGRKLSGPAVIVAIYNQKGGAGKSQTTMQLSAALSLRGFATLVVDIDTQGTSTLWSSQASEENPFPATVVSLANQSENLVNELHKIKDFYDFILVDCRPSLDDGATWGLLHIANIGIIPVIPLLDNLWASIEAKEKGLAAKKINTDLQLYYLPSNVGRGKVYEYGIESLRGDDNIGCFETILSTRSAFAESQYLGASVHLLGSRAKEAIREVESLTDEFLGYVGVQNKEIKT